MFWILLADVSDQTVAADRPAEAKPIVGRERRLQRVELVDKLVQPLEPSG
jgi:hypothetical protein